MKHKAVKSWYKDSDGIWIELADGYTNSDGGKWLHCETIKEASEELKRIIKIY